MSHRRKGDGIYRPIIQTWTQNVAWMMCQPEATVRFNCGRCGFYRDADLVKLVLKNPLTCLWNRRPPCPKCGEPGFFNGSPLKGTMLYPFTTDDANQALSMHRLAAEVAIRLRNMSG